MSVPERTFPVKSSLNLYKERSSTLYTSTLIPNRSLAGNDWACGPELSVNVSGWVIIMAMYAKVSPYLTTIFTY